MQNSARRLAVFILVCFFFSGMTALIYQVIWMRLISRVVGAAPFAVSAILVVFMAGLGLGGYIAGRMSNRWYGVRLVRVYGVLEIATAVYALFVPALLMLPGGVYSSLYNSFFSTPLFLIFLYLQGRFYCSAFPPYAWKRPCPFSASFMSEAFHSSALIQAGSTVLILSVQPLAPWFAGSG
ncbi:MAG: hypothetical protein ACLFNW_06050 [Desulfobacterales bacterium]